MSCSQKSLLRPILLVIILVLLAAALSQPASAALISLNRSPEPPLCIRNNGSESESYSYTITFSTIANYYTDVVKDPSNTVVRGIFYDCTGNNAGIVPPGYTYVDLSANPVTSPINRSTTYNPGAGAPTGRYEIEVTFYSVQGGTPFEARAAVTFYVCTTKGNLTITKFNDLNANGVRDPGEPGVANWLMNILTPIGDTFGRLTDANGNVSLVGVGVGAYTITEGTVAGWKPTTPTVVTVTVTDGGSATALFGNVRPISIGGGAYNDTNCDGVLDPSDTPLPGSQFTLTDSLGNPVTNADGNPVSPIIGSAYSFTNLFPGTYRVVETSPAGYVNTNAIPGSGGTKISNNIIQIAATTPSTAYTANNFLACIPAPDLTLTKTVLPTSQYVGGQVTYTFTVHNTGDTPLTVTSINDDKLGDLLPDFIAANGGSDTVAAGNTVTFTKNYTIQVTDPSPFINTVTLMCHDPFGTDLTRTDTATVTIIPPPPVSISGGAYDDLNCSGTLDPGDPPLAGATFTLTDLSGNPVLDIFGVAVPPQVGSTFNFINLPHASYEVTQTPPGGYQARNAIPGTGGTKLTNNQIRVDATTPGNAYPNQNFLDCAPSPSVTITKTPAPANGYDGTVITYTFVVNNTGNTPLTMSITDTLLGNITSYFVSVHGGSSLAAGQSVTFTVNHTIVPADPDPISNTVTASGADPFSTVVTGNASASVGVLRPCIHVTKTPVPTEGREGVLITYNYSVQNCGNRALTNVTVTDSLLGDLTADFVAANGGSSTLALAATVNFTKTHTLVPSDPDTLVNTVTVHGADPLSKDYTDSTTATVLVLRPCIDVTKTASTITAKVGDVVTYTYSVHNCGNVDLENCTVVDDVLGDLTTDFIAANGGNDTLTAGTTVTFTKTYTVPSDWPNPIINTVTATGDDPAGGSVTDTDSATVHIPVTISGGAFYDISGNGVLEPGDPPLPGATFCLTDLNGNPVNDLFGNPVQSQVGSTFSFVNLLPGNYIVMEKNPDFYTSTNAIPGPGGTKITNDKIRVDATPHTNYPNNWFLDTRLGTGCISGTKIDSDTLLPVEGVTIQLAACPYHVVETALTDEFGNFVFEKLPAGMYRLIELVPSGYESTGAVAGTYAQVIDFYRIGVDLPDGGHSEGNIFYDKRSGGCLNVTKTASPTLARTGDVITYQITVDNCGTLDIQSVTVLDDVLGDLTPNFVAANGGSDTLKAGVVITFSVRYTIPEVTPNPLVNTVTVNGTTPGGAPISGSATATVTIANPCSEITKTADPTEVAGPGETVTYQYLVHNCGDVNMNDVIVIDDMLGDLTADFIAANAGSDILVVSSTVAFNKDYTIPDDAAFPIVNTVTATGTDPFGGTKTSQAQAVVTLNTPTICTGITVVKLTTASIAAALSNGETTATVGETVVFTINICNCGNQQLNNITVTGSPCTGTAPAGDMFGDLTPLFLASNCGSGDLCPGCCATFEVSHVIAATDPNPLCVRITVDGTTPSGDPVSESTETTIIILRGTQNPYAPVTLTQEGWQAHCSDLIAPLMWRAFAGAVYYGVPISGKLVAGFRNVITFDSTNVGTTRLCMFLPQTAPCGGLKRSYINPWQSTESGALGGEVAALLMNIAYNDQRLMPNNRGYDLENFVVSQGFFKFKPVRQVLDAASRILGGAPPCIVGLPSCAPLTQIVRDINANYELLPDGTTQDMGYLIPNRGFGPPTPPHPMVVP